MTPKQFAALAGAAALCLFAALFIYSSSLPWTRARSGGEPLFASLQGNPPKIARIEIEQGGSKLTLNNDGGEWHIKEHEGFPATDAKVRSFLVSLSEAQLVEPKTRRKDRYSLLALEDPGEPHALSRGVKLFDADDRVVAEAVIGKQRQDAFGAGKGGTYVRRPGEVQTWLVDTEINAGVTLGDWIKPRLFEARPFDIEHLKIKMPGKDDVDIALADNKTEHVLQNIPEGMKVKYVNVIDDMAEAASSLDFDDVRKLTAPPAGDKVSTVELNMKSGLKCVLTIQRDGGVAWVSLAASGEGAAKKAAEALMQRAKGWEFRIRKSKADQILQSRDELLEKIAS
jgi:hypothetical protein